MERPTSLGAGHRGEHRSHLHTRKIKKNLCFCIGAVNQATMFIYVLYIDVFLYAILLDLLLRWSKINGATNVVRPRPPWRT